MRIPTKTDLRHFAVPEPRPYEPTIGQPEPGSNAASFLVWAEHAGRATIARLLLNTLLAVDNSVELGHVIDLLSRNRHMLASWSAAGDEVFGLADLAASLAGQEHIAVRGERLPLAIPAKRRLHASVASHYLQLALISGPPTDPSVSSVAYDGLRIWLLIEALGRAVLPDRPWCSLA